MSETTPNSNAPRKRPTEAFMLPNLFEHGMGHVVIARFKSSGWVQAGVFLIDAYCLGVKDAFYTEMPETEYDTFLDRVFPEGGEPIDPPCARKLIESAVAYARSLGLEPHRDYKQAARVLGGISIEDCSRSFTFGKDGKPLYIQGPHDSRARAQQIVRLLEAKCGKGHYDFIVLAPDADGMFE